MPLSIKKKTKKEKTPKSYPVKKLPSLLKKTYTEKKLNKKLLKKIYIPADKELVQSLFKDAGTNKKGVALFAISKEQTFTKKEIKRLKKLIKEIKKQKGRIKIVPLIAVASFIAALGIGFMMTKNIIIKKAIKSSVEAIAEARCDIRKVDLKIFESTFKLEGLEVANKNEPMKNIFSVSSITFDFDMLQLLKSRFVANEFSVYGVEVNSDRTYDGTLPPKKAKKIKKQKAKKEKKESPLAAKLQTISSNSLATVQNSLEETFAQYNPETMFNNFYSNLQTPAMAEKVQKEIEDLVNKYTELPGKLEIEVRKGEEALNSIININYEELIKNPVEINSQVDINALLELQKLQDPEELKKPENIKKIIEITNSLNIKKPEDIKKLVEIKPSVQVQNTIDTVTNVYNTTMDITKQAEIYAKDIQNDVTKTTQLITDVTNVISADSKYVESEIKKITTFKVEDGMEFISGTMNSLVCQLLGKYYPYVIQASDYLAEMKNNKKEKKAKKISMQVHRAAGRNIYYKNDKTPEFWIKKIAATGTGFSVKALNIANNMDIINKPATGEISLTLFGLTHNADLIVDTRTKTETPLITADYNCNQLPVSLPVSYFNNTPGVPGIDHSQVALDFILKIFENEGFKLEGKSNFTDVALTTTPFDPSFISDIYCSILSQINEMDLNFTTGYTSSEGFELGLTSNIDKLFMAALEKEMLNQLNILKAKIEAEVIAKINELTNGIFGEINSLEDIQNKVKEYTAYLENLPKEIENKKAELEGFVQKTIDDTQKQLMEIVDSGRNQLQSEIDAKKAQAEAELLKKKQEAEAEAARLQKEAEAELERQKQAAQAELERQKQAAQAEAERLQREAEEASRQKAKELEEEVKRKAAEEAKKQLKKFF